MKISVTIFAVFFGFIGGMAFRSEPGASIVALAMVFIVCCDSAITAIHELTDELKERK